MLTVSMFVIDKANAWRADTVTAVEGLVKIW